MRWKSETVLVVVVVAVLALWLVVRPRHRPIAAPTGFVAAGVETGLDYQMTFLPGEQGETFKINLYDHGSGLAIADVDGDGHDDVYFVNQLGSNALFRNRGDGTFENITARAGVGLPDRICVGAVFADFDNDGDQDLFVTSTRGGNVLFANNGDGTFVDVTDKAGVAHVAHSQSAVFFDYDKDGYLDLFVANTAEWTLADKSPNGNFVGKGESGLGQVVHSTKESNILYRNNGNGTFTDVTEKSGLKGRGWAGDALAFDYDEDGHVDLFVTCMFGRCQLYRNQGDGTFKDVTLAVLGRTPWGGVGARLIDARGDGRLSLFVADMHSDMWMGLDFKNASLEQARRHANRKFRWMNGPNADRDPSLIEGEIQLGREVGYSHDEVIFGNGFYRNLGGGKFEEVSDKVGLEMFWPWGAVAGDFNNDGHEDLFIPVGMGYPFYYWPNSLMMNQGDGTFVDRTAEFGVEPPPGGPLQDRFIVDRKASRSSRAAAVADFDGDGRLELIVNNFNDRPYYFRNRFPTQSFVAFRLRGTVSNRDAIGAIVRVHAGGRILTRQVTAGGGYLTQSSHTVHVGLGNQPIEKVEITWPNGRKQTLDSIKPNTVNVVVEAGGNR